MGQNFYMESVPRAPNDLTQDPFWAAGFHIFHWVSISLNMFWIQKLLPKAFHEFDASTAIGFHLIWNSQVFWALLCSDKIPRTA